tara:strand:+ start:97 stop:213 length:117 start_codon:yes stop_codon:yes gene_type:complete
MPLKKRAPPGPEGGIVLEVTGGMQGLRKIYQFGQNHPF